ncbi:monosaccharide ABC transporter substrate-binding protein (CUT2 family) [Murinocardiopsis flavida]|uniref:Monosaccharide ABC transporter substrate-binding protein (CUT2 family) n=1 Tax=Murinocardiopsis flavida TaxID=645275 RepID=A0A2P8DH71_9ACTN|nr:substrate-binding domain-containing protein [Murinocardiopsis flavida]PSK96567.1 monosaccharide ABC transporter substrate-binding protein (CUT2 family) [Murinocardiopsis flavida]
MRTERIIGISLAAAAALALTGCSLSTSPGGAGAKGGDSDGKISIGFSQATQQSPFYVQLSEGAEKAAKDAGAELHAADASGDVTKQNDDIQDLITKQVDVLLVNPVDPKGVKAGITAAESAGIPVVTVDRPVPDGAAAHVGRDNKSMGALVGERLAQELGDKGGKVIEIQGDAGGAVARDRSAGFHEAVEGNDKIKIVEGPYCDYIRSKSVTAMQDLIQTNPDVKAVYAHNDDMALGALQVLAENDRDDVLVAGVDGLMEAVEEINTDGGNYIATALNDPISLGDTAIDTAMKVQKGGDVEKNVDAGTGLVDTGNAADYAGDGTFAPGKPQ